jgi:hypothetical protein
MQGAARTVPERSYYFGGPLRQLKHTGPHMPPVPPRSHQQSWMLAFVREDGARHPAWPVTGWGVGASEDQQFVSPHGPPHPDASAAARQQMAPSQRIRDIGWMIQAG